MAGAHLDKPPITTHFKVLSLRDSDIVQDQLDVFNLLQDVTGPLQQYLQSPWTSSQVIGNKSSGVSNFWRIAASDMPGPLAQTSMKGPNSLQRGQISKDFLSTKQCIGGHPDYQKLMLTTDNMTCVSRCDGEYMDFFQEAGLTQVGVLLTMLSSKGSNYLNNSTRSVPWPNVALSPELSVIGTYTAQWQPSNYFYGRPQWYALQEHLSHNHYTQLLLFDIILGLYTSPSVQSLEVSGLEEAYEQIVQELVSL